ncbi:hypothetical protein VNI00_008889 [Paramarasmius palmivorus]|uniref:Uncharacterized protein n=1 Tax=Paramarasmius palmivorus TaxID=297713 RepID=A0AAW0CUQ0_9AGAR
MPQEVGVVRRKPLTKSQVIYAVAKAKITPRIRHTKSVYVPMTTAHRKAVQEERAKKKHEMKKDVGQWENQTLLTADALARKYHKKRRFFMRMHYQNGVRHIRAHKKVNSFTALKAVKARERAEGCLPASLAGEERLPLQKLTEICQPIYANMTRQEKKEIVKRYLEYKKTETHKHIQNPNSQSRAQDMAGVITNLKEIMKAAKQRCGIEGMFIVVRNTTDAFMSPEVFWSNPKWEPYMKMIAKGWDTDTVSTKLMHFSVADCDITKMFEEMPMQDKNTMLKAHVREHLREKLCEATGRKFKSIPFENFEKQVTLPFGVVVDGWPFAKFENPSKIGTGGGALEKLWNLVAGGQVKFRKLEEEEWVKWKDDFKKRLLEGGAKKPRKVRSDAGKKRKKIIPAIMRAGTETEDSSSSSDEDDDDEGGEDGVMEREPDDRVDDGDQSNQGSQRTRKRGGSDVDSDEGEDDTEGQQPPKPSSESTKTKSGPKPAKKLKKNQPASKAKQTAQKSSKKKQQRDDSTTAQPSTSSSTRNLPTMSPSPSPPSHRAISAEPPEQRAAQHQTTSPGPAPHHIPPWSSEPMIDSMSSSSGIPLRNVDVDEGGGRNGGGRKLREKPKARNREEDNRIGY